MEERDRFLEIVDSIKSIAISQNNQITREEVEKYLGGMELGSSKIDAVCSYLASNGIKVNTGTGIAGRRVYMQEAARLSAAGTPELEKIIKDLLMGNEEAKKRLAESKAGHVIELAEAYKGRIAVGNNAGGIGNNIGTSIDEVASEGNIGLMTGIAVVWENREQYINSTGEADCETVNNIIDMEITSAMENFIDQVTQDKDWENAMLAKTNLLYEAAKYLAGEYGRLPSGRELSEYTRIPASEISNIINVSEDTKKLIDI